MRSVRAFVVVVCAAAGLFGCSDKTPMVKASGVVFNINKFAFLKLMGTSGTDAFAAALTAGQVISTSISPETKSAPSGADGSFTVDVPANSTFFMVAEENNEFVRTQTIIPVVTQAVDIQVNPVIACPEVAETTILATGAGLPVADLEARGFTVFATDALPAPPNDVPVVNTVVSVAESADYDIYAYAGDHTGGVHATLGNTSPAALYGIVPKASSTSHRELHVTVTDPMGAHTFDPMVVPIDGSYFSAALALSTH